MLGHAKYAAGDQLGAIPHYLKVVSMDTLGVRDAPLPCRACDALAGMTSAYSLADSLPAAERSARAWARLQPSAARAWAYLATVLEYQGRFDEAVSVRRNALALRPGDRVDLVYPARVQLRQGNYKNADPMLRQRMSVGPAALAREASWYLIISLREQGRLREALEVAREYNDSLSQAMIRLEMGHARVAAEFFEAQAAHLLADTVVPRHGARIWRLAHAATARALAGDTGVLSSIADTIAALGAHTTAARNIKLRHYPLGLLYAARGDHQAAVRTFERSVNSLTNGYGRLNLELARSLIAINQPRRAVAVLEAGLRGPVDAGNYYVTQTDFRELLGAAYESAALPDSALIMYRRVLSAWNNADASLDMRRARLQHRVDALTRPNPRSAALARRP
jgi:tetratricopeptide (TPR) repeat protein